MSNKFPLMLCTHAPGGMRSVVEGYEQDGLLNAWGFRLIWTHRGGSILARLWQAALAYFQMLALLFRGKVSFMHVHAAMRGSFWRKSLFIATARVFGVPSIMHLHGSEMQTFYRSLNRASRRVQRLLEQVETVVVLSDSWLRFVKSVAPTANVVVVSNYVRIPNLTEKVAATGRFDVLFLGVLGPRKGVYDLIESWRKVLIAVPHARLLLGGNGEIVKAKALIESLGLGDSVQLLGWIEGDQKLGLLQQSDAYVLPSYNEGLPMSVLEAMACACPVVTTRVGGIPELITDGVDGILIEPGDKDALADGIIRLATELTFRLHIGQAGRARVVESYSEKAVLPKWDAIYSELSKRHG